MGLLHCNRCGIEQWADVYEINTPLDCLGESEFKKFYIKVIDKCINCSIKNVFRLALHCKGFYQELGYVKRKNFEDTLILIKKYIGTLPKVKRGKNKKGFYLIYSDCGIKKRCYSNLSSMKLGADKDLGGEYGQPAAKKLL